VTPTLFAVLRYMLQLAHIIMRSDAWQRICKLRVIAILRPPAPRSSDATVEAFSPEDVAHATTRARAFMRRLFEKTRMAGAVVRVE
jgi:hypothetical protein